MDTQNYHIFHPYFIIFSCISDIFPSDLDFETNLSAAAFPAGKNVACLKIDSASTDRVFRPPDLKPGEVRPRRHRPRLLREKNRCIEKTIFEKPQVGSLGNTKLEFSLKFSQLNLSNCEVVSVCVLTTSNFFPPRKPRRKKPGK